MRCLKIEDKWLRLILDGQKTWELRRTNINIRGRVALGNMKTRRIEGYAKIAGSTEMSLGELRGYNDKHQANDFIDGYAKGRDTLFVWILSEVEVEPNPRPYSHSTGPWCKT